MGSLLVLSLSVLHPVPEPVEDSNPFRGRLAARVVQGEPFRHLCRRSRRAASAAGSTGGHSASFGGRAYHSNICVAAAVTPRATVVANYGVDIDPGAVRALALGGT